MVKDQPTQEERNVNESLDVGTIDDNPFFDEGHLLER